ncbi:MAG: pyridoxamine 5'-phosphate oxidase family protein [Pseudomonadota bacterium]
MPHDTEFYGPEQRSFQDAFDSRKLADRVADMIVNCELDEAATGFIATRDFMFLASVDGHGQPTVSYKGGAPGFVQVIDPSTLEFPSYDGNGMFLSLGNIAGTGNIGLLFIDFEKPHRLRVQATAKVRTATAADKARWPGAQLVVSAKVREVFPNCPRYIHKQRRESPSPYVPDAAGHAPTPDWKRIDALQDALPEKDKGCAKAAGGTLTPQEYMERATGGE